MAEKKPGWDCWHPTCRRTVEDGRLVRTRPKGEPGDFMCLEHAGAQRQEN